MDFGSTLARIRRSRGWSQEELSGRSDLSQRHLSFLETGRAQPGDKSLRKLIKALALRGWEHRALVTSLAPLEEATIAQHHDDAFVQDMVERSSHWPAYAFKPDGTLIANNSALGRLLAYASGGEDLWALTAPSTGPNIYDLVFHPIGLVRWMINPGQTLFETLRRLRIEASQNRSLLPVLARAESYSTWASIDPHETLPPPVLVERYRFQGEELEIISVLSHFASPGEIEMDALRIESFVPANAQSEALIREICETPD